MRAEHRFNRTEQGHAGPRIPSRSFPRWRLREGGLAARGCEKGFSHQHLSATLRGTVKRKVAFATACVVGLCAPSAAPAGGINTNLALTPPKGGSILRLQYSFIEADGRGPVRQVNSSTVAGTYVFGVEPNLALFFTVPYVNKQVDKVVPRRGRIEEAHDGVADLTFLAKYRFWQRDPHPQETLRWAAIGGLNVRSGDSDFSSDSYDPIVGTVYSWQRNRGWLDADLSVQFNTGGGEARHDRLRYNLSYSYRLFPKVYESADVHELDAVAELNGRYTTSGSHEIFLSPGLQFITERWIFETSLQLPVVQELDDREPETEYRLVLGFRFQW